MGKRRRKRRKQRLRNVRRARKAQNQDPAERDYLRFIEATELLLKNPAECIYCGGKGKALYKGKYRLYCAECNGTGLVSGAVAKEMRRQVLEWSINHHIEKLQNQSMKIGPSYFRRIYPHY